MSEIKFDLALTWFPDLPLYQINLQSRPLAPAAAAYCNNRGRIPTPYSSISLRNLLYQHSEWVPLEFQKILFAAFPVNQQDVFTAAQDK